MAFTRAEHASRDESFAIAWQAERYGRRNWPHCRKFALACPGPVRGTLLFEIFPTAVFVLKLVGASYLIWMGVKSLKASLSTPAEQAPVSSDGNSLMAAAKIGVIVALTNPKSALFFGSVFATFVPADASLFLLVLIAVICCVQSALQHAITATVISTQPATMFFATFQRWITGVFGLLFIGMGGTVAASALRNQ